MMWPLTLWDAITALDGDPEAQARLMDDVMTGPGVNPLRPTMTVRAPCCGRRTAADTVVDARTIPGTVVRGVDREWMCDDCWTRMIRDTGNGWTMSRWVRAIGAPAQTIREHRAREVAEGRIRAMAAVGRTYRRHEEVETALAEIPANTREIPGTERPVG